jgi:hypothetical protein
MCAITLLDRRAATGRCFVGFIALFAVACSSSSPASDEHVDAGHEGGHESADAGHEGGHESADAGSFLCGADTADDAASGSVTCAGGEFCIVQELGKGGGLYSCARIPAACASTPDCTCLAPLAAAAGGFSGLCVPSVPSCTKDGESHLFVTCPEA